MLNREIKIGVYMDLTNMGIHLYDDEYERYTCGYKDEKFSMFGDCGEKIYFGITFATVDDDYFGFEEIDPTRILNAISDVADKVADVFDIYTKSKCKFMVVERWI